MSDARHQILDIAGRLFAERGYELVGINEIIEKSGVAKATFYAHFKSKERLCAEWLKAEASESEASARELLRAPVSAEEKLQRKFDGLRDYCLGSSFRGCPFSITASMMDSSSEVRDVIRDYKAAARVFWQSLAMEFRRDPAEARALGDALFLLFSGAVTEAQNARSAWPVDAAKAAALILTSN
jgi:AcrR family transcriptional regulator